MKLGATTTFNAQWRSVSTDLATFENFRLFQAVM
jgi:hypothetical protein